MILGARKIKAARKTIEKVEISLGATERAKIWFEEYSGRITAAVAVVLLILAAFWGFNVYSEAKEREAQAAYAQLITKWPQQEPVEAGVWEPLISDLQKYVKEYAGTKASMNAELDLSKAYMQTRKYEEASKCAKRVLEAGSSSRDLRSLARYGLANTFEAMGKTDEALMQWNALKGEGGAWLGREADWHLARLYWKKADYSKAVETFDKALNAPGSYPSTALLQEERASVKVAAESGREAL